MSELAYQRLADLWEAMYGDKPSVVAEAGLTAQILVECLPRLEPYRLGLGGFSASRPSQPGAPRSGRETGARASQETDLVDAEPRAARPPR